MLCLNGVFMGKFIIAASVGTISNSGETKVTNNMGLLSVLMKSLYATVSLFALVELWLCTFFIPYLFIPHVYLNYFKHFFIMNETILRKNIIHLNV